MSLNLAPRRYLVHSHWFINLLSYVVIAAFALRRVSELDNLFSIRLALAFTALLTVLYAAEPVLSRRFKRYPFLYFALQIAIIQILGIFRVYIDTWAMLYIILGFQVAARCSPRVAFVWAGLFVASVLITLSFEFGLVSGLGRGLAYIVIGVLLVSYDILYDRHRAALEESQLLLGELREAHARLLSYAAQAEELAAVQERDRLVKELYDSVGQKVFAIQLAAEAARLALTKDPQRLAVQLADLQEQTQSTLRQMRQLIEQWRPA